MIPQPQDGFTFGLRNMFFSRTIEERMLWGAFVATQARVDYQSRFNAGARALIENRNRERRCNVLVVTRAEKAPLPIPLRC